MRTRLNQLAWVLLIGILSGVCWAQTAVPSDPLQRLDAGRFGPGTLIAAMEALDTYKPPQAVPLVRNLLGHTDLDVARTAAWLLRRMGRQEEGVSSASNVLGSSQADPYARRSAALALGVLRSPSSLDPLRQALESNPYRIVRAMAARALGQLHRPGAVSSLEQAIVGDESLEVRRAAARALGSLPDSVTSSFLTALSDDDALVRMQAAYGLGRRRLSQSSANLQQVLQIDTDCRVKAAAVWALGELGDSSANAALKTARDEDACRLVKLAAASALAHLAASE